MLYFDYQSFVIIFSCMSGEQQRKQFVVPKKEELVDIIKEMDDQIENVSLNLIKCDFNAIERDVEKAFPDYQFIKVKKYNPGSFEVVFQTKIDAINFIRHSGDKKILTRRFFIKMGRQQRQRAENWAAVGYVPKQFKKRPPYQKGHKKDSQHKEEQDTKQQQTPKKEVQEVIAEQKAEPKKEGPKVKAEKEEKKPEPPKEQPKKQEPRREEPKVEEKKVQAKKEEPKKQEPAAEEKRGRRKQRKNNQQNESKDVKKEEPKKEEPKKQTAKPVQQQDEDDGWIVVPKKTKGRGK